MPAPMNLKAKQVTTTSTATTHVKTILSSASLCGTSNQEALLSRFPTSMLITAARNALGDIGNRLPTNVNSQSSSQPTKPSSQPPVVAPVENVDMSETADASLMEHEEEGDDDSYLVEDIDEYDLDNAQACADYVKDVYCYLHELERMYKIRPDFLVGKTVTSKMRSVLVDWLIQVHQKFNLLNETLYLCVYIIDTILEMQDVPKLQLQLVGVTALLVACKYEEMIVPSVEDFAFMTDNTYTTAAIRTMEISILKAMKFMLCKPNALNFLRRFSKAGEADPKQHTLAKFFMEQALHDADFSGIYPSALAAASLCLSLRLLNQITWCQQLEHYSTYTEASLLPIMQKIAKLCFKSMEPDYKYKAVINKFRHNKFLRISYAIELSGPTMQHMALHGRFDD